MKIRTPRPMSRVALLSTVALATAAAALAFPGTAQAEFGLGNGQASVTKMHESVLDQIEGRTFGWQLAIAQNGQLKVAVSDGTAVSQADNNGNWVSMKPTQKMELASVTKNITAVATMKLLRRNNLTVESKVWPYLPLAWDESKFKAVKFKHLLTHTSGINQALAAMPADKRPTDNSWASMRIVVENGTTVDSQRQYKNANFAMMRVLNAKLWKRSGGGFAPVTAANHTTYVLDYMRKHIFEPAGLFNIGCIPSGTTTGIRSYALNSNQTSKGAVFGTSSGECAGARGIALSSVQLVRYLAHLRHGSIINPADLDTMDELRAGWSEDANGGDGGENGVLDGLPDNKLSPGAYWHGGDLFDNNTGRQLHTCAMTFDDGTEATLLINSAIGAAGPGEGTTQCGILLTAWTNAKS
jgi:CubicO group peptidase (beta-lactamase class C family)